MIHYRSFRNSDPPALVRLWNAAVPAGSAARPLRVHELDEHAFNAAYFDRRGLIVAEREGVPVGFVHAGFGPAETESADGLQVGPLPLRLDSTMGVVAMLAVDPALAEESEVAEGLVVEAERYLRAQGAQVVYGGCRLPLNPFYWGLYGGSEAAGIPSGHIQFAAALGGLGYEPISTAVHLHFDLSRPDPRDPRAGTLRRLYEVRFQEDPPPQSWWENLALGEFHPIRVSLHPRGDADAPEIARARCWDMAWFGREDARPRIGVIDVEVRPELRRQGFGRFLVGEIYRFAREREFQVVEFQTLIDNDAAMSLYHALDLEPVDQSTVFRLPAPFPDRSRP